MHAQGYTNRLPQLETHMKVKTVPSTTKQHTKKHTQRGTVKFSTTVEII